MKSKFTVVVWAGTGIGGTEKAASLFAVELAKRGHRIIYLASPGPRDADLVQWNVGRMEFPATAEGLAILLKKEQADILHQHVPGYSMPNTIYKALRMLGGRRPRLIETNVFGRLEDRESDKWVDFRFFISHASGVQAFQRAGRRMDAKSLPRMSVVLYPLPSQPSIPAKDDQRAIMREELGIQTNEIFILRIGRPGIKWNWSEVQTFQEARRQNPLLRMLLMEPREEIWDEVESGKWGEGILLQRTLSDFNRLAAIYAAGDLMLHMADWGESYGYTIAEAMQEGLPVITRSTPWGDNAQVELVEHGVTGLVCNSNAGAIDGLLALAEDRLIRAQMGRAAMERIAKLSNLNHETDLLEEIMQHVVQGKPLRQIIERNKEWISFRSSFAERERRVRELDVPTLKFSYRKGVCYGAYRSFRNTVSQWMRNLKSACKRQ